MSFADFEQKAQRFKPRAAFLVHVGGHIAFESEQIAAYCAENDIFLIEDCAPAHGASWNGRRAGSYGDAGVYSLYATKTISTGEGGVLVSKRPELLEFARALMAEPKVLLLDEPMAGINPTLGARLLEHIHRLRAERGMTFLFVEHDMEVVMGHSDRVIVMAEGRVIATGPPEEVRRDKRVIDAYLGGGAAIGEEHPA